MQEPLTGPYVAAEHTVASDLLGHPQVGDPRFDAGRLSLPDAPHLGFVQITAGPFWLGSLHKTGLSWDIPSLMISPTSIT